MFSGTSDSPTTREETLRLWRRIALMILGMLLSVLVTMITVALAFGFYGSYLDLQQPIASLELAAPAQPGEMPLRLLLIWGVVWLPFFLMPYCLELLLYHVTPPHYLLLRRLVDAVIRLIYMLSLLQITNLGYVALYADQTQEMEFLRQLDIMWYILFQGLSALATGLIGGLLYHSRVLPSSWPAQAMMVGGAVSVLLSLLGTNPELPIVPTGLLFIPYTSALVLLAIYLLTVRSR